MFAKEKKDSPLVQQIFDPVSSSYMSSIFLQDFTLTSFDFSSAAEKEPGIPTRQRVRNQRIFSCPPATSNIIVFFSSFFFFSFFFFFFFFYFLFFFFFLSSPSPVSQVLLKMMVKCHRIPCITVIGLSQLIWCGPRRPRGQNLPPTFQMWSRASPWWAWIRLARANPSQDPQDWSTQVRLPLSSTFLLLFFLLFFLSFFLC